ncbi:hypothetical protein ACE1OC_41030 [Streptomyces sp. DSM 116496]|uniref:hypothetical protein n=1 Tax=Streptomyces stoeckheimensis TaxID=3344656 RepID=UPI0038B2F831
MSTPRRRPLGTGPGPAVEEQHRTDGRRTIVERATTAPDSGLTRTTPAPAPSGRRLLGNGPSAAEDF